MLVFHNQNLVMFAVPKTGTTALEAALQPYASVAIQAPPSKRHMNRRVYGAQLAPVLRKTFGLTPDGMAIVREPVERLRSWYRYRGTAPFLGTDLSTEGMDFEQFIERTLEDTPPQVARIGTQDRFVSDGDGQIGIKHLFDYAQMPLALDWLSDRLGRPVTLAERNRSPLRAAPLSPELLDRLKTVRAGEFALYTRVASAGHLVSMASPKGD